MMKKAGFTLAEVLITLTIIGVIATLTLPALMSNVSEQQNITAFKKIINSLSEAGQMNGTVSGFDYSSVTSNSAVGDSFEGNNPTQSLMALFDDRLQVDQQASSNRGFPGDAAGNECGGVVAVLRDNTSICFAGTDQSADNVGNYILVWVDVNGVKGPNLPSTCSEEGCTTRNMRVIRDRFPVTLVGGNAIPGHWTAFQTPSDDNQNDFAARYAMTK